LLRVNESFAMLYSLDLPLWWLQAAGPASDVSFNNVWWSEPSAPGRGQPGRTCIGVGTALLVSEA